MIKKYHNEDIPAIKPVTEHFKKVDVQLLIEMMYKQTPTMEHVLQDAFMDWVGDWLIKNKIDAVTELDQYGNMYITKGKADVYPACVSHVD